LRGLAGSMPVAQATAPDIPTGGRWPHHLSLGTYWALVNTPTRARCHSCGTRWRGVIVPNANGLNTELATLRHRAAEGERISAYLAALGIWSAARQVDAAHLRALLRQCSGSQAMVHAIAVQRHGDQRHTVDTVSTAHCQHASSTQPGQWAVCGDHVWLG
jgi:hypothetical protein